MKDFFDHRILREYSFGLIDASMVEWLPDGLMLETLVPTNLVSSAHLMPRLLALHNLPIQHRHDLLRTINDAENAGDQPPVTLFVKTNADLAAFVCQWNAAQVCEPRPGQKAWLRLHDTRVLHQLLRILPPSQRHRFFSNSQSLAYWIDGEWVTESLRDSAFHDVGNATVTAEPVHEIEERLSWDRIDRIGMVNRVLSGAGIRHASALWRQGVLAEELINRAKMSYGLIKSTDLIEFAVRGLTSSSTFDEHPDIAAVLNAATCQDDDSSLADKLAIISEQVWVGLSQSQ